MDKRISSGSGCYDYHPVIAAASTTTTTRNHYTPHLAHIPLAPTQHAAQSQFTPQTHHSHSHCRYGGNRTRLQQTINNTAAASSPIALGGPKSNPKLFHGMNPNSLPVIGIHSWHSARHDEQLAANVAAIAAARSRQQMTAAAIAAATTTTTPGGNLHNNNNNYINSGSNGKLQQQQKPALPTMPTIEGTGTTTTTPSAFRTKPRNKSEGRQPFLIFSHCLWQRWQCVCVCVCVCFFKSIFVHNFCCVCESERACVSARSVAAIYFVIY